MERASTSHPERSRPDAPRGEGTSPDTPRIALVVPARDEAPTILDTIEGLLDLLGSLGVSAELIVVDDGSTDETPEILERAAEAAPRLVTARLEPGLGKGAALAEGFSLARAGTVGFVDADGQIASESLREVIELALARPDAVVVGARTHRRVGWTRRLVSATYRLATVLIVGVRVRDVGCPSKVFPARIVREPTLRTRGWVVDAEILQRAQEDGLEVVEVPVSVADTSSDSPGRHRADLLKSVEELWTIRRRALRGDRRTPLILASGVLALVLLSCQALGISGRGFERGYRRHSSLSSTQTLRILRDRSIRGRIVLFVGAGFTANWSTIDVYPLEADRASGRDTAAVDADRLVMASAVDGIAREVYLVTPSGAGGGSEPGHGGQGTPSRMDGVPITRADPASLPGFGEKVVVILSPDVRQGMAEETLARLTDPSVADTVITQRSW